MARTAATTLVRWTEGLNGSRFAEVNGHKVKRCTFGWIVERLGADGLPAEHVAVCDDVRSALIAAGVEVRGETCTGCGNRVATTTYPDLEGVVVVGHDMADTEGGFRGGWCDGSFLAAAGGQ